MSSPNPIYEGTMSHGKEIEMLENDEQVVDNDGSKPFGEGLTLQYSSEHGWLSKISFVIFLQLITFIFIIIVLGVAGATLHKTYQAEQAADPAATVSAAVGTTDTSPSTSDDGYSEAFISELARNNTWLQNQLTQVLDATQNIWSSVSQTEGRVEQFNYTEMLNQVIQTTQGTSDMLTNVVSTLTNLEETGNSMSAAITDILFVVEELLRLQNASILFNSITPVSCQDIKNVLPNSPSGYYHVNSRNIYCNMDELCGSDEGWTRLGYLDMSDSTQNCPTDFAFGSYGGVRACKRSGNAIGSCNSVSFDTNGISYSEVCGRVEAFQYGHTDAISPGNQGYGLESYYVDGVSITRGSSPRKHVWTLMAGLFENQNSITDTCPCYTGSTIKISPTFVGDDYYCESGNPKTYYDLSYYTNDILWDGKGCTSLETNCCTNPHLPWFYKSLGTNTTDYIELRLCGNEAPIAEDSPITYYEIYVK